jgi:6-phosphogluconolactonase
MRYLPPLARVPGFWIAIVLAAGVAIASGCGPTNGLPELTGEYVYVANAGDGTISVFSINTTTGALTFIQSVAAAPTFQVFGLALHWSNEFLYATIDDQSDILSFDIGDGSFSGQIFGHNGPYPAVNGPRAVALNPDGTYLYATNNGGTAQVVSQYTVDQSTGVLTANGTAPTGVRPFGITVSPGGNCAYVANTGDGTLSEYGITSTGTLSFDTAVTLSTSTAGPGPEMVAVQNNPNGEAQTIYVTDDNLGVVHQVQVYLRTITSTCAGIPSVMDVSAKGKAFGIALHPSGKFVYTGNSSSNSISVFSVASNGLLSLKSQETANLSGVDSIAVDLQGKFLYAANFSGSTVAQFSINSSTGALTPIAPGKVNTESPANKTSGPITIVTTVNATPTLKKL